uniref:zinc finger protein 782-like isoform X5 n=1 Tax=Halichoerus grypus TaxID=9711 RepID=UPI001659DC40|nr:zinc finger protein 782-like isoform X5 [Halichoerus grypus]
MNTSPVSVSFKDVTVESTQEEGQKIGRTQRTLYREVMLEIYSHLVSMDCSIMLYLKSHHHTQGYCYTKPEVILRLDQAEDPCLLEKEFLIRRSSEEVYGFREFDGYEINNGR